MAYLNGENSVKDVKYTHRDFGGLKNNLIDFAKTYGVKYPLLYGSSEKINKIASDYGGVSAVPWSFLIDTNGEIITIYPGAILKQYDPKMYQDLVNNIEKYLDINK